MSKYKGHSNEGKEEFYTIRNMNRHLMTWHVRVSVLLALSLWRSWTRQVCVRWVASLVTPEVKEGRRDVSSVLPARHEQKGETQRFSNLLTPKGRSTWTSLHIMWRGQGGGAWLSGIATERLLLLMDSCLSVTLEEARNVLGTELKIIVTVMYLFVANYFI